MIEGKATVSATFDYFESKEVSPINLRSTGWYASFAGIGTYRMSAQNPEHIRSFKAALESGINVIDTAINYMDTLSEELVGKVLQELTSANIISREQVILISKAGYIQGRLLQKLVNLEQQGKGYEDVVKFNDQLWYSIDPQFISDMVELSCKRMNVKTIDIYLLHNPEYLLQYEMQKKGDKFDPALDDFLFYQKIKKAFITLEEKVKKGQIQFYGVSSNTLPTPPEFPAHVNALKLLAVATEAAEEVWGDGKNHHFKFLQFPLNLIEMQGYLQKMDEFPEGPMTLFEFCRKYGIDILTNRPLNAIWKNELYRFATYPADEETDYFHAVQKEMEKLLGEEHRFHRFLEEHSLDQLPVGEMKLKDWFTLYAILKQYMHDIQDMDQYYQFIYGYLAQRLRYGRDVFEKALTPENMKEGLELYNQLANRFQLLSDMLKLWIYQRMNQRMEILETEINRFAGGKFKSHNLSFKTMLILRSIHEPFIMLNGMRRMEYVENAIQVMREAPLKVEQEDFSMLHKKIVKKLTSR